MAFEGYAELLSNKHGMKTWRKFRKCKAAGNAEPQAAALFPAVVDSLSDQYYGFVMQSVASMHAPARHQRGSIRHSLHRTMGYHSWEWTFYHLMGSRCPRLRSCASARLHWPITTPPFGTELYFSRTLSSLPILGTWKRERMSRGGITSPAVPSTIGRHAKSVAEGRCGPVWRFANTRAPCQSTCGACTSVTTSCRPCLPTLGRS